MASKFFKGGKYVYEKLVPNIAKNLTARRKTTDEMIEAVDKHTKSKTTKTSKIKKDAVIKGSKIHDKYEKLKKILEDILQINLLKNRKKRLIKIYFNYG